MSMHNAPENHLKHPPGKTKHHLVTQLFIESINMVFVIVISEVPNLSEDLSVSNSEMQVAEILFPEDNDIFLLYGHNHCFW